MSYIARTTRLATIALGFFMAPCHEMNAQAAAPNTPATASGNSWEVLFSTGALVPTGVQRRAVKDAALSTGQLSYVIASRVAITSTVGWARSRDLLSDDSPRLSVFTYDVGVEARAPQWHGNDALSFTPFAGAGAGGRSFTHRDLDVAATHAPAGYASLGGELAMGRARVRLEARDYLTAAAPLVGFGKREARNDVILLAGFRWVRKHDATD